MGNIQLSGIFVNFFGAIIRIWGKLWKRGDIGQGFSGDKYFREMTIKRMEYNQTRTPKL